MSIASMLASRAFWRDEDFDFDSRADFGTDLRHVYLPSGGKLYDVSVLKHAANFGMHFCPESSEIWAYHVESLYNEIAFGAVLAKPVYVPRRRLDGMPSARGYAIECNRVLEFGHCFEMPSRVRDVLLGAKTKAAAGMLTERAFLYLVNARHFPTIFLPGFERAPKRDDICNGIDFINREHSLKVQVKFDKKGGSRGTGNLFIQTHTLPISMSDQWSGATY